MTDEDKVLRANCKYCGKEVFSLYKNQLKNMVDVHELHCPMRKKDEEELNRASEEILDEQT